MKLLLQKTSQFLNSMKIYRFFLMKMKKFALLLGTPLAVQLCYFVSLSSIGFLALKVAKPKFNVENSPKNLDLFFMSVSASTVSSMATIEMEDFSNRQLWVLIFLMLFGGEVLVSMLGLQIMKARLKSRGLFPARLDSISLPSLQTPDEEHIRYGAVRYLASVVLFYLVSCIAIGSILVSLYMILDERAGEVLERKEIKLSTFSIFLAISSFMSCGFTPANESMMPFKKSSILQLLVVLTVLAGNTMLPPCLRSLLWTLKKATKSKHCTYLLQNPQNIGYEHLFTYQDSVCLASTVFLFIVLQVVLFCSLEWNSASLGGLNPRQKLIGAVFQSVNARHAGESIFDLSTLSSAVLVLCIVMMYLPPYTRYLPGKLDDRSSANVRGSNGRSLFPLGAIIPQLCLSVIFVILICITERRAIIDDPLNFSVLNIVFEVISAYGNVGFSLGYSCKRLLNPDSSCKEGWYGFVGRWSDEGKLVLLLAMLSGRLKRLHMNGGKAWKLS